MSDGAEIQPTFEAPTAELIQDTLVKLLDFADEDRDMREALGLVTANFYTMTYSQAGVLTRDKGVVLKIGGLPEGRTAEYQITVVRKQ